MVHSSFGKFKKIFVFFQINKLNHFIYSSYNLCKDVNIVHFEQLSINFQHVFNLRENDTILKIVFNEQAYFAHKNILSSSSLYLK